MTDAADTHVRGAERAVRGHCAFRLVEHHAEIVMRADDFKPLFLRNAAERFIRNGASGCLRLVIAHGFQLFEGCTDRFFIAHKIADGIKLYADFFHGCNPAFFRSL